MVAANCRSYAAAVGFWRMSETIWAALISAVLGAGSATGLNMLTSASRRNTDTQIVAVRLTSAVENIASQLERLHIDIKEDRRETFGRINEVEQRVSKLEGQGSF